MARIRDPAREKAYTLWKEAGGRKAPKGILKEIAKILNKSESLIRKWKNADEWDNGNVTNNTNGNITNGNGNVTNRKSLIKQAKSMVEEGSTIKEASTKTGINYSSLRDIAAKENWLEQQEKFMQRVYKRLQDELCEEHISERKKTIKSLSYLKEKTLNDVLQNSFANLKHYNTAIKNIGEATELQSKFLGLPEMKMYIRQDKEDKDLEKSKPIFIAGGNELED